MPRLVGEKCAQSVGILHQHAHQHVRAGQTQRLGVKLLAAATAARRPAVGAAVGGRTLRRRRRPAALARTHTAAAVGVRSVGRLRRPGRPAVHLAVECRALPADLQAGGDEIQQAEAHHAVEEASALLVLQILGLTAHLLQEQEQVHPLRARGRQRL